MFLNVTSASFNTLDVKGQASSTNLARVRPEWEHDGIYLQIVMSHAVEFMLQIAIFLC